MYIAFPKSHNLITTLGKIGVALFISTNISFLDRISWIRIYSRIAMPKITIPLNNNTCVWYQYVHNKFTSYHLLFQVLCANSIKYRPPGFFEFIGFGSGWKTKNAINTFLIFRVISATMRAIFWILQQTPARNVKRFSASFAFFNLPRATYVKSALPGLLFCLTCCLPSIRAIQRAKSHFAISAGHKFFLTLLANIRTTIVTPFGEIRAGSKYIITFSTGFLFSDIIIHNIIIPWRVGKANRLRTQSQ